MDSKTLIKTEINLALEKICRFSERLNQMNDELTGLNAILLAILSTIENDGRAGSRARRSYRLG